jgi:DUF4097 and DUF4098 domain-containing protein YvlB
MSIPTTPPLPPPATPPGAEPPPYPPRYRRRSIFAGLLLIIIGVLLLVATLRPGFSLGYVITHFWPVIIIVWGVAKLIDRYAQPAGAPHVPMLTGGEVSLIFALIALVVLVALVGWAHNRRRSALDDFFTQHYSETKRIDVKQVDPNSLFAVTTPSGAINIHPGDDKGLLVIGTAHAPGNSEADADARMKNLDVSLDGTAGAYRIHPVGANGNVSVDLDVQLPKPASVTARTSHGDVTVADVQGPADVATRNGDVQIHDVNSNVTTDLQNGDAHIRNINGAVSFTGRGGGDVEITDAKGAVNLGGNIFGEVNVRNALQGVHYSSPRANVQIASLPGETKIDNGDIVISNAVGPITVNAKNQDVRLTDVTGPLDLSETRGDIQITLSAPPKAPIDITSDSGDVSLTLPAQSAFTLSASSNSGDISDDFSASQESSDNERGPQRLNVTYGTGGPAIHITTKYGNIHIAKQQ